MPRNLLISAMKIVFSILLAAALAIKAVVFPCHAEDVLLEIQPGSSFLKDGSLYPLAGTMAFGPAFLIDDPNFGQALRAQTLTALRFAAGPLQFQLHSPDSAGNLALSLPGPSQVQCLINATVDMLDAGGAIVESGLSISGISTTSATPAEGLNLPVLSLYRNPNPDDPELVGTFSLAATVVPEPVPIALLVPVLVAFCLGRHRG